MKLKVKSPRVTARAGRANIVDVARRADVSIGTVSNVLNHPDLVSDATRKKVERAIKQLRFVRNASARQLRAGRSQSIGLLVLDYDDPSFTEVASGIEEVASASGYLLTLCNSNQETDRQARFLRMLDEQRVRGILVTPVGDDMEELRRLRRNGTTVVLLDYPSPTVDFCSVAIDDVRGGELAAAHLLELGHQRIGLLSDPTNVRQVMKRREGVQRALAAAGRDSERDLMHHTVATQTIAEGIQSVNQILAAGVTAVICANDILALGVLRALTNSGASAPDDLAVVGYGDTQLAEVVALPLTSVRQPMHLLGKTAAELLIGEVSGDEHEHRQVTCTPELMIRQSSVRARR